MPNQLLLLVNCARERYLIIYDAIWVFFSCKIYVWFIIFGNKCIYHKTKIFGLLEIKFGFNSENMAWSMKFHAPIGKNNFASSIKYHSNVLFLKKQTIITTKLIILASKYRILVFLSTFFVNILLFYGHRGRWF